MVQEDTISINHNWVNAFSLPHMWRHLKRELKLVRSIYIGLPFTVLLHHLLAGLFQVQLEISDCRGMDGWEQQCQVCAHHFVSRFLLAATSLAGQTSGCNQTP